MATVLCKAGFSGRVTGHRSWSELDDPTDLLRSLPGCQRPFFILKVQTKLETRRALLANTPHIPQITAALAGKDPNEPLLNHDVHKLIVEKVAEESWERSADLKSLAAVSREFRELASQWEVCWVHSRVSTFAGRIKIPAES